MKKNWKNRFNIDSLIKKEKSVIGILSPIYWDKEGKIKEFSIYSDSEEDILIKEYQNKSKLEKLLNKRVLAKGEVKSDENGDKWIKLKSIRELTGPTSPAINVIKPLMPGFFGEEYSLALPKDCAFAYYN